MVALINRPKMQDTKIMKTLSRFFAMLINTIIDGVN